MSMTSQLLQSLISYNSPGPAQTCDCQGLFSSDPSSTAEYTPVLRPLGDTFTVCDTAGGAEIKLNQYPLEDLWKRICSITLNVIEWVFEFTYYVIHVSMVLQTYSQSSCLCWINIEPCLNRSIFGTLGGV